MAKIYGRIGCLTNLIGELEARGIYDFKTMDDIRAFRNGYKNLLKQIKEKHRLVFGQKLAELQSNYEKLSGELTNKTLKRKQSLQEELRKLRIELTGFSKPGNLVRRIVSFFRKKKLKEE